jgi:hypothetical protein
MTLLAPVFGAQISPIAGDANQAQQCRLFPDPKQHRKDVQVAVDFGGVDFLASVLLRGSLRARIDLGLALAVRRFIGGGTADARHFDQPLSIRGKPYGKLRILIVLLHGTPER